MRITVFDNGKIAVDDIEPYICLEGLDERIREFVDGDQNSIGFVSPADIRWRKWGEIDGGLGWISVKRLLPESCAEVWAYNGKTFLADFQPPDIFFHIGDNETIDGVTYWMPIVKPEPPA